ncbi:NAD(P)-dependent alcohol dehydrogenase [Lacisediminihabitans profunda]|uniref:NAD(P)-dependent alcohol dehydrogenase n=1 Tax=Lacisediminihabitans profunda TaxID=2594790 RepID=UPI001C9CDB7E|nr:NAD(P)-dependent alcohol dehydrogenase [Lacisediminihabitans profunda]
MPTAAIVWKEGDSFSLEEIYLDELRSDEVRVHLVATGVCHTDLSAANGSTPFPLPGVLGHEGAGIVEAVGTSVTRTKVGDRVLLSFTSCGRCAGCRNGHPALCDSHLILNLFGGRRADGTTTLRHSSGELNAHFFGQSSFSETAVVDERSIVVLPSDTTNDELIIFAPLGCGFQTGAGAVLNVLRPEPGSTIAVTGAGAVGLAAAMAARMTPASRVIVIDRVQSRLELAKQLGASDVIDTSDNDLTSSLLDITDGRGVDYVVETTGNVGVLEASVLSLAVGGTCALIGAPRAGSTAAFDVNRMLPGRVIRGITLGDSEPQTFIPVLIDAYRRGLFPIDRLERVYPFADINAAAADAAAGVTIKPVLVF